ncbi:NnrS family protein [Porticoccus sp.]|uniref:NnrS family protein n=1 Tax=Porticoccus sp. TaxID=2024853 RepID=UPI003F6A2471
MIDDGERLGLYVGFYMIITLVLIMARRVIPFFTERGVGYSVTLKNYRWIDLSIPPLMVAFVVAEVADAGHLLSAVLAGALLLLNSIRLVGWYTSGIWRKPLLWVLHVAYMLLTLAFGLKVASVLWGLSPFLAVHTFALAGIGLMTLGMMARVSLGHTGRDLSEPPPQVQWMFLLLCIAIVLRVLLPLLFPAHYPLWIILSQLSWILSFALFALCYIPILVSSRIDGRPG